MEELGLLVIYEVLSFFVVVWMFGFMGFCVFRGFGFGFEIVGV